MQVILTTNALEIIEDFENANDEVRGQMKLAMFRALSVLKAQVQQNLRADSGLNVRTGTLLNSITYNVVDKGFIIEGQLGPENVPYAAIHEFGGELSARFVKPVLKKALKWKGMDGDVFSAGHWMPPIKIPARPYLAPAVIKHQDMIAEKFAIFIYDNFKMNMGQ